MSELETNVLIIGKSGSGKSSLLNYLFGCKMQETGAGRPVTPKELFEFEYDYDDEFKIHIYDTWGLEPDRAEEWKSLIMGKVQECDAKEISQWFNTIIFCLNGNSQLVEEFELAYMRELINEKNNIVVAITHCYENEGEMKDQHMTQRLLLDADIPKENIIYVSSVEGAATIGGLCAKKFGRDEIFTAIIQNLWTSLRSKVPYNIEKKLVAKIAETGQQLKENIKNKSIFFRRKDAQGEIEDTVNREIERLVNDGICSINYDTMQAVNYYNKLSKKYADIMLIDRNDVHISINGDFDVRGDIEATIEFWLDQINESQNRISELMKGLFKDERKKEIIKDLFVSLKERFTRSVKIKRNLDEAVDEQLTKVKDEFKMNLKKIQRQLDKINVNAAATNQIEAYKN